MHIRIRNWVLIGALAISSAAALAQEPGEQAGGRAQFAGMQRVAGTVVSVTGDAVTVKGEDGTTYTVTTTPNTRVMKGQMPFKVADLKAGDGALALGNMDAPNKTLHAAMMTVTDIDNLKMTVTRPDCVSQTIGFDETTSFKRGGRMGRGNFTAGGFGGGAGAPPAPVEGGESITLADIKVGDNVTGTGSLKGGVFVPAQLNVSAPRAARGESGARTAGTVQHPATPQQ